MYHFQLARYWINVDALLHEITTLWPVFIVGACIQDRLKFISGYCTGRYIEREEFEDILKTVLNTISECE